VQLSSIFFLSFFVAALLAVRERETFPFFWKVASYPVTHKGLRLSNEMRRDKILAQLHILARDLDRISCPAVLLAELAVCDLELRDLRYKHSRIIAAGALYWASAQRRERASQIQIAKRFPAWKTRIHAMAAVFGGKRTHLDHFALLSSTLERTRAVDWDPSEVRRSYAILPFVIVPNLNLGTNPVCRDERAFFLPSLAPQQGETS